MLAMSKAVPAKHAFGGETYTPGYSTNVSHFMARRTAQSHAGFLLPCLKPGMRLLDCGCGPGTITLGLAQAVAPGQVVGIDREQSQLAAAAERFKAAGLQAEFRACSIYELPFADALFDVVFSHAVFEHLKEPRRALAEIYRVLKPGGLVALRSPDWGLFIIAPGTPMLDRAIEFYKRLQTENGGDVLAGRKLKGLLVECGWLDVRASGAYEFYEPLDSITEYLALRIEGSVSQDKVVERGWVTEHEIEAMTSALRALPARSDGLFLQAWCEAIGRKSDE